MRRFVLGILTILAAGALILAPGYTYRASAFTQEETEWIGEAQEALEEILSEKDVMALVYLTDSYIVRKAPDIESSEVAKVLSGQQVMVRGVELTQEYEAWVKVEFYAKDVLNSGYIERRFLACSDELFLQWEADCGMYQSAPMSAALEEADGGTVYADVEQFPESYKSALNALKKSHPNWIFVKMDTGLEWDTVVAEELKGGRSLIPSSLGAQFQEGKFSNSWSYATEEALEYYLDPRNGLTENGIFQFEQLTFNASYHENSQAALQSFLDNTFMKGNIPGWVDTYAYGFWVIGKSMNISPFHLASRVYQEQGRNGTSPLISGTYPGYEGYYNYFNIGASGSTDKEVIESGLSYAKRQNPPWNTPYYALHFGAEMLGANYIAKGQDTLYLQKFDVDDSNNGMYWHQYMQNICAPSGEAVSIRRLYEEVGALENIFVFKIPVYKNMPEVCPVPTESDRIILEVPKEYTDTVIYLDGTAYTAEKRNGYHIVRATHMNAKTAVMYRYNEAGVPVGMMVWRLKSDGRSYQAEELEGLQDLLSYHGFSIRITGRAGIRYKTGIRTDIREALLGEGIEGYRLKEYGNLVMTDRNRANYPMVKGGEKVSLGMSYGMDAEGNQVDTIYETIDGRHRFTSVLVGLPADQYKTEFAFRGYAVLEKDGEEIILYGPIMHRSIYSLAQQVLDMNLYQEGTDAYQFLTQLISDGDNAATETDSVGKAD